MAYVGTPRFAGSDLETLASILQGEAGGEGARGLQAVASVIQNRANQNFSGYGNSLIDQALARNQFQGQSSNIGPEARAVASQLVSGKLPDVTSGALYYANPGASTASWAKRLNDSNALKIGNHYFTNNADGKPFTASPYAGLPDGPKGQESYAPPALGSIAPSPMPQPSGIPTEVAAYATSQDGKSPLADALKQFGQENQMSAPRPSAFPGGPTSEQANGLFKTLNGKTIADLLMGRRLRG